MMVKNHSERIVKRCLHESEPLCLLQEQSDHSFKEAMKLEAVNLLSPENIHVATVTRVKGQYIWLSLEGVVHYCKNAF